MDGAPPATRTAERWRHGPSNPGVDQTSATRPGSSCPAAPDSGYALTGLGALVTEPTTSAWSRSTARPAMAPPPSASITARSVAIGPDHVCPAPRGRSGPSAVDYAAVSCVGKIRPATVPRHDRPPPNHRHRHKPRDATRSLHVESVSQSDPYYMPCTADQWLTWAKTPRPLDKI